MPVEDVFDGHLHAQPLRNLVARASVERVPRWRAINGGLIFIVGAGWRIVFEVLPVVVVDVEVAPELVVFPNTSKAAKLGRNVGQRHIGCEVAALCVVVGTKERQLIAGLYIQPNAEAVNLRFVGVEVGDHAAQLAIV